MFVDLVVIQDHSGSACTANASTLDQTVDNGAISTDSRQIAFLITQAENAIDQAVSDCDMTQGDAGRLRDLLAQSSTSLAASDLFSAANALYSACEMFD